MTEYTQIWKITYPDKPCDVVRNRAAALGLLSRGAPGSEIHPRLTVRHDDGRYEYLTPRRGHDT